MSNYTKATNFASKDALTTGNPLKTLSGTELDDEFNSISTAVNTKANASNATLTGIPTAPTATADTNTTQVATTAFVTTEANLKADLAGAAFTGAITTTSTIDGVDIATRDGVLTSTTTTATAALPKAGGALTGPVTTNSTIDGVDIATRDGVLTTTATVALEALPKAGGALSGPVTTNSTFDGRDVVTGNTTANAALPKAGGTMSGLVNFADQLLQSPVLKDYSETKVAMAANDADLSLGNVQTKTISGTTTLTFSNPPATGYCGSFTLLLTNGGSSAVTWPTSVVWPAATAPTLTASGVDLLVFTTIDAGTKWYGIAAGIGMG